MKIKYTVARSGICPYCGINFDMWISCICHNCGKVVKTDEIINDE